MKRMKKIASILDAIFRIVYYCTIAAFVFTCIMLLLLWWLYLIDSDLLKLFRTELTFGSISFTVADSVTATRNTGFLFMLSGTIYALVELPVFWMTFSSIRGILAPMKEGRPFDSSIARYLKRLAWLTIVNGILTQIIQNVLTGNTLAVYDLNELFLSDKITGVSVTHSYDLSFLIYALILFLMSFVFRHGTELQKLSDETL